MANEYDELNTPDERAKRQRQQFQARRQRQRLRLIAGVCVGLVTLLVLCVVLLRSCEPEPAPTQPVQTTLPPASTAPSAPKEGQTVIHIVAGGDVNVTDSVIAAGFQEGRYDFSGLFMDIAPILSNADAALVNFEGNLVGAPYGTENASAPQELMEALERAGVDFVQMANSYSIKNGIIGLNTTLNRIRQAGMEPLGAFASQEEYDRTQGFTIQNIQGVRVAFVAFTKGVGGLTLPSGSEDRVNLLYTDYATGYQKIDEDGIKATLSAVAAQQPDVTIALLHWGSEHKGIISENQKKIKALMLEGGVDAIIGTHSHYVQQVVHDPEKGTLIAYSLGDFFGDGEKAGTNYSILLDVEITKSGTTGKASVTGFSYTPVYISDETAAGRGLRLLRIREAVAAYESNSLNRVSEATYRGMVSALERIEARVNGT